MQNYTIGRGHEPYKMGYEKIELLGVSKSINRHLAIITVKDGEATIMPMQKGKSLTNPNKVYVNDFRIKQKKLTPNCRIKLLEINQKEPYWLNHFFKLDNGKITRVRNSNDFSQEFQLLKRVWDNYEDKKWAIEKEFMFGTRIVPIIICLFIVAVLYIFGKEILNAINGLWNKIGLLILVSSLLSIPFLVRSKREKKRKDNLLDKYLTRKFLCPKCRVTLSLSAQKNWKDWKEKGGHSCQAKWT